jgi:hypothetical protein
LLLLASSCHTKKQELKQVSNLLTLNAEVLRVDYIDSLPKPLGSENEKRDSITTIHIKAVLFNHNAAPISYVTTSCTDDVLYLTDISGLTVFGYKYCFCNTVSFNTIPPFSAREELLMIRGISPSTKFPKSLKVGFRYSMATENNTHDELWKLYDNIDSASIIWSNEIQVTN